MFFGEVLMFAHPGVTSQAGSQQSTVSVLSGNGERHGAELGVPGKLRDGGGGAGGSMEG